MKPNLWGTGRIDYGFLRMPRFLLDTPKGNEPPPPGPDAAALAKENAEIKEKLAAYEKEKAEREKGNQPPPKKDDPTDLAEKARLEREANEKKAGESKTLEGALKFTMGATTWAKENASLLPKNTASILEQADKENYGSAIQKANAIKEAVVLEFFAQQPNLDLLTESQKEALADFKLLTKNDRQDRVQQFYASVFEPTLESLRKIKKAEALQKGLAEPSNAEDAYTKKLMEKSQAHHYRGKK